MLRRIAIVFAKEAIDNLRDRRSLGLALLYPFFGPLMVGALIALVGQTITKMPSSALTLPVVGAERAPALLAFFAAHGIRVTPTTNDPERLVRSGEYDVALVVPEDYAASFGAERAARIRLVSDGSRLSSMLAMSRALFTLRDYNRAVSEQRLARYGVAAEVVEPVAVEAINVSVGSNLVGFFLNMLPPFVIFTVFVAGIYLAIDATVGERERGSLEPLLATPVARWELMAGKVAAGLAFTALALAVHLGAFSGMFAVVDIADLGIRNPPSAARLAAVFAVALPLAVLAVAVQTVIAGASRSLKESQTYLGLLPLIPALPGLILVFVAIEAKGWMMAIPALSQTVVIGLLVRGETPAAADLAIATVSTLAAAAVMLWGAARLYGRERLVLGR